MNNISQTKDAICGLISDIAPEVDTNQLDPNEDMRDELDLDSMDFIRLLEGVEKECGVNIPESDYAKINTLQSMAEYIDARHGA
jgi:acyl carrier protein